MYLPSVSKLDYVLHTRPQAIHDLESASVTIPALCFLPYPLSCHIQHMLKSEIFKLVAGFGVFLAFPACRLGIQQLAPLSTSTVDAPSQKSFPTQWNTVLVIHPFLLSLEPIITFVLLYSSSLLRVG